MATAHFQMAIYTWVVNMGIIKDLYMEEYEKIMADAEEEGITIDETKAGELAYQRSIDRFADMCAAAKDRAKYE